MPGAGSCGAAGANPHRGACRPVGLGGLPAAGGATLDLGLGDLAGGDQCVDAALRELVAVGAHAGAYARTVRVMLAAVGIVVGGAGELDREARSGRLVGVEADRR